MATLALVHGLVHAQILMLPVLLLPWADHYGLTAAQAGLLAAAAYVAYGATSVPAGYLADGRGGKGLVLVALGGTSLGGTVAALAPNLPTLALGLTAMGVALGMYHPTGLAIISRGGGDVGRAMGVHGVGGSLGIALGPLSASLLLAAGLGPGHALLPIAAISALALVPTALVPSPHPGPPRVPKGWVRSMARVLRPPFPLVMAVYFLAGVAYWGTLTFLPAFLHRALDGSLPKVEAGPLALAPGGYLYPTLLAGGAMGQYLSGTTAGGPNPEVRLAMLSAASGLALLPLGLGHPLAIVPSALAFGFLLFSLEPLQNMLVMDRSAPSDRGLAFGFTFVSVFGMGALGAALGGFVVGLVGYAPLFPLLALPLVISGLASWILRPAAGGGGQALPSSP